MNNTIQVSVPIKKFWQSSNFYFNLILLTVGLVIGFQEELISNVVGVVFELIAVGGLMRDALKAGKLDLSRIKNPNWWAYLAAMISTIFTFEIPAEFFTTIQSLLEAIAGKNFNGIITAVITLISIGYGIWKKHSSGRAAHPKSNVLG